MDTKLERVARGVGVLVADKPAGLYQVKLQAGTHTSEELIKLGGGPFVKSYPPLRFSSPVPLDGTYKTHEFHRSNAEECSRVEHVTKGTGSHIYIFARDWTSKNRDQGGKASTGPYENPARGLRLVDESGVELVDFEEQSATELEWEPWAACNVSVEPGSYILRLNAPDGTVWERTLVASPGWQTQCFLLQRDYKDLRIPDLPGATVLLREKGLGFTPGSSELRLIELARLGLMEERPILSAEVEELLAVKFENPMLGIFGAHLLLNLELKRGRPYEPGLLRHVVGKLRDLLNEPHQDVEALAWKAGLGDEDYRFKMPPMLRRSWTLMTHASADRPEVIPQDSLPTRMYDCILAEGPWLVWSGEQSDDEESQVLETLTLCLQSQMPAQEPPGDPEPPGQYAPPSFGESLAQADFEFPQAAPEPKSDIRELTEQLNVPRSVVEKYFKQATDKAKTFKRRDRRRG
ncbi:MAG: hypothetical protein ABW250_12225 [Pyrinomonadaceae bacterium]